MALGKERRRSFFFGLTVALSFAIARLGAHAVAEQSGAAFSCVSPTQFNSLTRETVLPLTKHAAEEAASLLNVLAGGASVISASCASLKQLSCAGVTAIFSGLTWVGSGVAGQVALDIDDQKYKEVFVADLPPVHGLDSYPDLKNAANKVIEATILSRAVYLSANRAAAAAEVGDEFWTRQQLTALDSYEARLKEILPSVADSFDATKAWAGSKLDELKTMILRYEPPARELAEKAKARIPSKTEKGQFLTWVCSIIPDWWGIRYLKNVLCATQ